MEKAGGGERRPAGREMHASGPSYYWGAAELIYFLNKSSYLVNRERTPPVAAEEPGRGGGAAASRREKPPLGGGKRHVGSIKRPRARRKGRPRGEEKNARASLLD